MGVSVQTGVNIRGQMSVVQPCYYLRLTIPQRFSLIVIPMTNGVTEPSAFASTAIKQSQIGYFTTLLLNRQQFSRTTVELWWVKICNVRLSVSSLSRLLTDVVSSPEITEAQFVLCSIKLPHRAYMTSPLHPIVYCVTPYATWKTESPPTPPQRPRVFILEKFVC